MTKLADWLYENSLTPEQLRRMLGVSNRSTITRYLNGERIPLPRVLQIIERITGGEVVLADFLDTSPPKCAVVIQDEAGEDRLVFPWSRGTAYQKAVDQAQRHQEPGVDTLSDAVTKALEVLASRARFTKRGVFLLDGRVSDARRIVMEANRILEAEGKPLLAYPGAGQSDIHGARK